MRIKPWILTGLVTACAATALGVIVAANDPTTAPLTVRALFWATLVVAGWGMWATLLLVARMNLPQAAWGGLALAGGGATMLGLVHAGWRDWRLLTGVGFVTLSIFVWLGFHCRSPHA